jgi:16S rRNA (uracil1498-N3)-methyltransferase
MTCRRFFSQHAPANKLLPITGDEFFHLRKVNRAIIGDKIEVINGKGTLFRGEIVSFSKDQALIKVYDQESQDRQKVGVIIAPSLTKRKAMNIMIEKLTEIGVDEIRPVIFSRTEENFNSTMIKRWKKIAQQSLKVNKMLFETDIYPPVSYKVLPETIKTVKSKILLHMQGKPLESSKFPPPIAAVIGPPGGLLTTERDFLHENGYTNYSINNCTLKSETAAISIAAILKMTRK